MSRLNQGFSNLSISSSLTSEAQEDLEEQRKRWLNTLHQAGDRAQGAPCFTIILPPDDSQSRKWNRIKYSPLPTGTSIRLIRLNPLQSRPITHPDLHRRIVCSIKTVDLEDRPPYTALSYCWGDPQSLFPFRDLYRPPKDWAAPSFEIYLEDGQPVSVSANLYTALLSLRNLVTEKLYYLGDHPDGAACPCSDFWIDALCIDQANNQEKASQVSMMHRIYKEAAMVNVWLGGSDPASDIFALVSTRLKYLFSVHINDLEKFRHLRIDDEAIYQRFDDSNINFSPITVGEWLAVYAFFSRSWFSRAWVVQELAFAKKAFAICGTDLLDIDELVLVQNGLRATGWGTQLQRLAADYIDVEPHVHTRALEQNLPRKNVPRLFKPTAHNWASVETLVEIFQVAFGLGRTEDYLWKPGVWGHNRDPDCYEHSLRELIGIFHASQATDPRDKIFAFLGMSEEFRDGSMASGPRNIKPSYDATVRQVFIEAAAFTLHTDNMLQTLEMKNERTDDVTGNPHNLPSWVPDFSTTTSLHGVTPWRAIDGPHAKIEVDILHGNLNTHGFKIGTVTATFNYTSDVDPVLLAEFSRLFPGEQAFRVPYWDKPTRVKYKKLRWTLPDERPRGSVDTHSSWEMLWRTCIRNTRNPIYLAQEEYGAVMLARLEWLVLKDMVKLLDWYGREWLKTRELTASLIDVSVRTVNSINTPEKILQAYQLTAAAKERSRHELPIRGAKTLEKIEAFKTIVGRAYLEHKERFAYMDQFRVDLMRHMRENQHPNPNLCDLSESASNRVVELTSGTLRNQVLGSEEPCMLFQTSTGLMGNAPATTKAGDEIWLLPGLRSPAILRNVGRSMVDRLLNRGTDNDFIFIGASYIHGIMHGEAAEDLKGEYLSVVNLI